MNVTEFRAGTANWTAVSKTRTTRVGAAIDIGSNSIHLLVARLDSSPAASRHGLTTLEDRSVLLGLGDVVDADRVIPTDTCVQIIDAVVDYAALSAEAGAHRLALIGTEPLRRAQNANTVAAAVLDNTGYELHIISVDQEAELTVLGVTGGRAPDFPLIVVDIGGGSTEVGIYRPGAALEVAALPIGSARLTNSLVHNDPPTEEELDLLHDAVAKIRALLPTLSGNGRQGELQAVFVGGTATNLARLGRLSRAGLAEDRRLLHEMESAAITEHFGVRPRRARQLAAGAAIVEVLLAHFGIDEAVVSTASLRDGAIIAEWRFGDEWPKRLSEHFAQPAG